MLFQGTGYFFLVNVVPSSYVNKPEFGICSVSRVLYLHSQQFRHPALMLTNTSYLVEIAVKFAAMSQRQQVLSLYKRILNVGRNWQSKSGDPATTASEKTYIKDEARSLFRQNQNLTDHHQITDKLREAEARLEIALHYRIPYPRPVNMPPNAKAKRMGKEQGKVQERIKEQSKPLYAKSLD